MVSSRLICAALFASLASVSLGEKHCVGDCQVADDSYLATNHLKMHSEQWDKMKAEGRLPNNQCSSVKETKCTDGAAGEYGCERMDLLSFMHLRDMGLPGTEGGVSASDIWGWTDSVTGMEVAIVCLYKSTAFVDVTTPTDAVLLGVLPQTNPDQLGSSWRDLKVFKDHAFIVSDANPGHGIQVLDLAQLRGTREEAKMNGAKKLSMTVLYPEHGSSHNIAIDTDTGIAYSIGSDTCRGGLHMVDINDPLKPKFLGCYDDDGYTHDTECVMYHGPDQKYYGREVCFGYNADNFHIIDVEDKENPVKISNTTYPSVRYTHQGWLTEDHAYALMNDELDELQAAELDAYTRTLIWDVRDLSNPVYMGPYTAKHKSIDHNLYIYGSLAHLANYCDGLRVLSVRDIANANLVEVAHFDVAPDCDTSPNITRSDLKFLGSWSSYQFPESNTIVVSSIERGLFVLGLDMTCTGGSLSECVSNCPIDDAGCVESCVLFC